MISVFENPENFSKPTDRDNTRMANMAIRSKSSFSNH
jgi:hypothetical protein